MSIIFDFGKYRGVSINEVDSSYLLWLYGQEFCKLKYPKIYNYIKRHKKEILEEYNWDSIEECDWFDPYDLTADSRH